MTTLKYEISDESTWAGMAAKLGDQGAITSTARAMIHHQSLNPTLKTVVLLFYFE